MMSKSSLGMDFTFYYRFFVPVLQARLGRERSFPLQLRRRSARRASASVPESKPNIEGSGIGYAVKP